MALNMFITIIFKHLLFNRLANKSNRKAMNRNWSNQTCGRNLVLTDLLAFAIDFWMLPRYIPEHFGFFSEV